jgi:hypothetical protein
MPRISASSRSLERAISSTLIIASTSSISASRPTRRFSFIFFSICVSSVSTK